VYTDLARFSRQPSEINPAEIIAAKALALARAVLASGSAGPDIRRVYRLGWKAIGCGERPWVSDTPIPLAPQQRDPSPSRSPLVILPMCRNDGEPPRNGGAVTNRNREVAYGGRGAPDLRAMIPSPLAEALLRRTGIG
jgi:hypothetical protein